MRLDIWRIASGIFLLGDGLDPGRVDFALSAHARRRDDARGASDSTAKDGAAEAEAAGTGELALKLPAVIQASVGISLERPDIVVFAYFDQLLGLGLPAASQWRPSVDSGLVHPGGAGLVDPIAGFWRTPRPCAGSPSPHPQRLQTSRRRQPSRPDGSLGIVTLA